MSPDTDRDSYLSFIGLGTVDEEMCVAHVGKDDVGWLCVFLIEDMIDKTVVSKPGRTALGIVSHSPELVLYLVLKLGELEGAVIEVVGCDGVRGYLGRCNRSIFDVISEDTAVLQASGIELTDGAVLAAEAAIGVVAVVPDLVEAAVLLIFDKALVIAGITSLYEWDSGLPIASGS